MSLRSPALVLACFAVGLCSCGSAGSSPALKVDDVAASLQGVRLGSAAKQVARAFRSVRTNPGYESEPLGQDHDRVGGPNGYGFPAHCRYSALKTADVAFGLCNGRVFFFMTTATGASTRREVKIGEPLARAQRLSPHLRCGLSTGDSTDPPVPLYRYCSGPVAEGRYLWFGQDPIRSIAMATVELRG